VRGVSSRSPVAGISRTASALSNPKGFSVSSSKARPAFALGATILGFLWGAASLRRGGATRHLAAAATANASMADKSKLQTQIENLIALNPVVIISKNGCPFCSKAQDAIKKAGGSPSVVCDLNLDELRPQVAQEIQDIMQDMTGARTVPRVFIGRKFIGGGDDIVAKAKSDELATLISEAKAKTHNEVAGKLDNIAVDKDEGAWKKELSAAQYRVLRGRGTERPHSHEYNDFQPDKGYFACGGCSLPLYSADSKYRSSCGWPVFKRCYYSEEVGCHVGTRSDGSGSLEIFCPRCNSHLGHVFFDDFSETNRNGERH